LPKAGAIFRVDNVLQCKQFGTYGLLLLAKEHSAIRCRSLTGRD